MTNTRIALITGAGRGLGQAAAIALAADGVDSIITYRGDPDAAAQTIAAVEALGAKAVALPLDTTELATFAAFADAVREALQSSWGRESLDVLINNAGVGGTAPFAEFPEALFDQLFAVHVKGVFFLTQALLPLIADGGSILNYSSGLTRFVHAGQSAYAAAKGAVEVLTRYLAVELGGRGIRVNTIAPGATATDFGGGMLRSDQARAAIGGAVALGRIGEAEDIGQAIAAIVSENAHWINAQRIEASGGQGL